MVYCRLHLIFIDFYTRSQEHYYFAKTIKLPVPIFTAQLAACTFFGAWMQAISVNPNDLLVADLCSFSFVSAIYKEARDHVGCGMLVCRRQVRSTGVKLRVQLNSWDEKEPGTDKEKNMALPLNFT